MNKATSELMQPYLNRLKLTLKIEMGLGLLTASFLGLLMGTFAMDPPWATELDFYKGAAFGFCLAAIPMLLIPFLALHELAQFKTRKRLFITKLNAGVCFFFVFFPLAIWQFYLIKKLIKKYEF